MTIIVIHSPENNSGLSVACFIELPGDEVREPAFGMKAVWISEVFMNELIREGFAPIDNVSVLLTHMSEVIRNNLSQLLSYKDMRILIDRLGPKYKRLTDENLSFTDFVFRITGRPKALALGTGFDPELAPHSRGNRRDCSPCSKGRTTYRTCTHADGSANLW